MMKKRIFHKIKTSGETLKKHEQKLTRNHQPGKQVCDLQVGVRGGFPFPAGPYLVITFNHISMKGATFIFISTSLGDHLPSHLIQARLCKTI